MDRLGTLPDRRSALCRPRPDPARTRIGAWPWRAVRDEAWDPTSTNDRLRYFECQHRTSDRTAYEGLRAGRIQRSTGSGIRAVPSGGCDLCCSSNRRPAHWRGSCAHNGHRQPHRNGSCRTGFGGKQGRPAGAREDEAPKPPRSHPDPRRSRPAERWQLVEPICPDE